MKTIAHYFTSPNLHKESSTERAINGNKKQASVKVLFEKTNCSEKDKIKSVVKCNDEVEPIKQKSVRPKSRKKLKFDSEKSNKNVEVFNHVVDSSKKLQKNKTQKDVCENLKIRKKGNSLNTELKTKDCKQNDDPNYSNNESSKNTIKILKSVKRKQTNDELSYPAKKRKSENIQINAGRPGTNSEKCGIEKSKSKNCIKIKTTVEDKSGSLLTENKDEYNVSSAKKKRKNSLQNKPSKKMAKKVITPEHISKSSIIEENHKKVKEKDTFLSNSKKKNIKDKFIETTSDTELDSSIEVFDTKVTNKRNQSLLLVKDRKLGLSDQNVDSTNVSPTEKTHNSLFSYFSKVDKETAMTPKESMKIKVKALIHSPPKKQQKNLSCRKNVDRLSLKGKGSGTKSKAQLKASDKIDILSSEVIEIPDESNSNTAINVSSEVIVSVNDNKVTPMKKSSGIGNYFKVDSVPKTHNSCKTNSKENTGTPKTPGSAWTMRIRLPPKVSEPLVTNTATDDDSDVSCDSQLLAEELSVKELKTEEDLCIVIKEEKPTPSEPLVTNTAKDDDSDVSCDSQLLGEELSVKKLKTEEDLCIVIKEEKPTPSVKMFSLFSREEKLPKAIVDPAKLEAKARFLESGAPESIKRKVDFLRSECSVGSPAPFPCVSHVQQQGTDDKIWKLRTADLPLGPSITQWEGSPSSTFPLSEDSFTATESTVVLKSPGNVKAYLLELKNQEPDMAVDVLYKNLRNKKKKKLAGSTEIWTEVYKPETASEIIGNSENINKLKTWLQVQKNIRKREGSVSSGDEFADSDSGGENKLRTNNMAILTGPYGCGKTCAVYAVANELGCEVLEINSSCNRTGKRLLIEFSESTQSHNVELSQSMLGLFSPRSMNKLKKKKRKSRIESNDATSGKTSLLLVEDADILFANHDEGFVSAIAALISTSKRPVILTVNDPKCLHLSKFDSINQLKLTFNKPRASKLALWLRLVALVEGVGFSAVQAQNLVEWSNGDVRQSLLQLQLMVKSKISQANNERNLTSLWWNWPAKYNIEFELPTLIIKDDVVEENLETIDKEKIKYDINSIASLTNRLANMDVLSPMHHQNSSNNPCPRPWENAQVHATNLTEEDVQHDLKETLNLELSNWLARTVINETKENTLSRFNTSSEKRWSGLLRKANNLFLPAVSLSQQCCHRAVTSDYLPALRTLGRAEQSRLTTYTRRANRYFSYLNGLGIHANKSFKDFMCDCFSQDYL